MILTRAWAGVAIVAEAIKKEARRILLIKFGYFKQLSHLTPPH